MLARAHAGYGGLAGSMAALGEKTQAEVGREMLARDVLASSAIEGEIFDSALVRLALDRRLGMPVGGLSKSTRPVDGMVDMVFDAVQNRIEPLPKKHIYGWHTLLFRNSKKEKTIKIGVFRSSDTDTMQVVSGYYGHEKVHYEAPEAARLEKEIAQFLSWFSTSASLDPILKSAISHFWFVTIHPFDDGNGRLGRVIGDYALSQPEKNIFRFYSLSSQLEKERNDYYTFLEMTQKGTVDVTEWLCWYTGCFTRAIDAAEKICTSVIEKETLLEHASQHGINEKEQKILTLLADGFRGKLTSDKYAKLAKCSLEMAEQDISHLVLCKILTEVGESKRGKNYILLK